MNALLLVALLSTAQSSETIPLTLEDYTAALKDGNIIDGTRPTHEVWGERCDLLTGWLTAVDEKPHTKEVVFKAIQDLVDQSHGLRQSLGGSDRRDHDKICADVASDAADALGPTGGSSKERVEADFIHAHFLFRYGVAHKVADAKDAAILAYKSLSDRGLRPMKDSLEYIKTLEVYDPAMWAVERFNKVVSASPEGKEAYDNQRDLLVVLNVQSPGINSRVDAAQNIAPYLNDNEDYPHFKQIALVICQIIDGVRVDGKYTEAISALEGIDAELTLLESVPMPSVGPGPEREKFFAFNEKMNIPFYIAITKMFRADEDVDSYESIKGVLENFHLRNGGRPQYVADRLVRILRNVQWDPLTVAPIAEFLQETDLHHYLDDEQRAMMLCRELSAYERAGDLARAKAIGLRLEADHNPAVGYSNAGLWDLARIYYRLKDFSNAERLYRKLAAEHPDPAWRLGAKARVLMTFVKKNHATSAKTSGEELEPLYEELKGAIKTTDPRAIRRFALDKCIKGFRTYRGVDWPRYVNGPSESVLRLREARRKRWAEKAKYLKEHGEEEYRKKYGYGSALPGDVREP